MSETLPPGRVLHFNEQAWNALHDALINSGLDLMAEHVAEQRKKPVVALDLDDPKRAVEVLKIAADDFAIGVAPGTAFSGRDIYRRIAKQIEDQTPDADADLLAKWNGRGIREDWLRQIIASVREHDAKAGA